MFKVLHTEHTGAEANNFSENRYPPAKLGAPPPNDGGERAQASFGGGPQVYTRDPVNISMLMVC